MRYAATLWCQVMPLEDEDAIMRLWHAEEQRLAELEATEAKEDREDDARRAEELLQEEERRLLASGKSVCSGG